MKIQESAENYLETILMEQQHREHVRAIDVCNALGFSKPTVSVAMKNFRQEGYVAVDESGYITLTEKGAAIAGKIYERHLLLTKMLMAMGVSEETARKDACKIEHDLSEETFSCMKHCLEKNFENVEEKC